MGVVRREETLMTWREVRVAGAVSFTQGDGVGSRAETENWLGTGA